MKVSGHNFVECIQLTLENLFSLYRLSENMKVLLSVTFTTDKQSKA